MVDAPRGRGGGTRLAGGAPGLAEGFGRERVPCDGCHDGDCGLEIGPPSRVNGEERVFRRGPGGAHGVPIAGRLHWYEKAHTGTVRASLLALRFTNGTLTLTEAGTKRRASLHVLSSAAQLAEHDRGGVEVLGIDPALFRERLSRTNHTLKRALTDPTILSGIGNAYSDELLHRARHAGHHIGALCDQIHRTDGEIGVKRILGVLALARKHGAPTVDDAAKAAIELGAPTYRFLRRYLERRPAAPLTLRQVDPLIRQLSLYRDLITQKTGDPT